MTVDCKLQIMLIGLYSAIYFAKLRHEQTYWASAVNTLLVLMKGTKVLTLGAGR